MPDESRGIGGCGSEAAYILLFVSNALPTLAIVIATVILYRGRDIFLPITMASILAVIFIPVASFLSPYVGRFASAALVVILAIGAVTAVVYFLTVELTAVADEVSGYSDNIGSKLGELEKSASPPWLQHLEYAVSDIQRQVQRKNPAPRSPKTVQAIPAPPTMLEKFRPLLPVLDGIVEGLLITVLLFFLLYSRKHLRDRVMCLIAKAQITMAPHVLGAAAEAVGRYMLLFSLTNLGFGLACGFAAWLLGLPSALLWGLLAFLLRFIPYVGAIISAFLPALVAFALFPGWAKPLEVIGSFVLFDQIVAQLIEPLVVGKGIGVSPVALLISAMYWSWLWGIPGLLLATPLTACLKVAGESIPTLGFFSVLLSADQDSRFRSETGEARIERSSSEGGGVLVARQPLGGGS